MEDDVAVFGVVGAAVAEEELSLPRREDAQVEGVVLAVEGVGIAGKLVIDEAARAAVAEGDQVLLGAVELEVDIYFFELRLAAVEEEGVRRIGRRWGRTVEVRDGDVRPGQRAARYEVVEVDDRIRRITNLDG